MAEIKVVGRGIGGVVDFHGFQSPVGHHLDIFLKGVFAELIEHRMGENRDVYKSQWHRCVICRWVNWCM